MQCKQNSTTTPPQEYLNLHRARTIFLIENDPVTESFDLSYLGVSKTQAALTYTPNCGACNYKDTQKKTPRKRTCILSSMFMRSFGHLVICAPLASPRCGWQRIRCGWQSSRVPSRPSSAAGRTRSFVFSYQSGHLVIKELGLKDHTSTLGFGTEFLNKKVFAPLFAPSDCGLQVGPT